jgi:hypothetical protein
LENVDVTIYILHPFAMNKAGLILRVLLAFVSILQVL